MLLLSESRLGNLDGCSKSLCRKRLQTRERLPRLTPTEERQRISRSGPLEDVLNPSFFEAFRKSFYWEGVTFARLSLKLNLQHAQFITHAMMQHLYELVGRPMALHYK